jgi:hypothetical protein
MPITELSGPHKLSLDEKLLETGLYVTQSSQPKRKFYRYKPLQNFQTDIRILRLLPSTEPDEVCCSLETHSINDNPFYVAVSYEWGDPEPEIDIRIDGRPFRIRHNLWLFLYYLQTKKLDMVTSDSFRLWADAICIDQGNIAEKNAQVQIMSRIFKQADSVFAWLGYPTHLSTKTTIAFIREASYHGRLTFPQTSDEIRQWCKTFVQSEAGVPYFRYISVLEVWKMVLELSKLSYWSRRWIVQEILLARHVSILLDDEELPWTAVTALFSLLNKYLDGQTVQGNIKRILSELRESIPWKLWRHRAKPICSTDDKFTSLALLLQDFGSTFCTVAYDRIYAFLSLVKDGDSVQVDYASPIIDVFCRLVSPGRNALLNETFTFKLAAELGLCSEPKERHERTDADSGPFVRYTVKISDLVRIIDVNLDWASVIQLHKREIQSANFEQLQLQLHDREREKLDHRYRLKHKELHHYRLEQLRLDYRLEQLRLDYCLEQLRLDYRLEHLRLNREDVRLSREREELYHRPLLEREELDHRYHLEREELDREYERLSRERGELYRRPLLEREELDHRYHLEREELDHRCELEELRRHEEPEGLRRLETYHDHFDFDCDLAHSHVVHSFGSNASLQDSTKLPKPEGGQKDAITTSALVPSTSSKNTCIACDDGCIRLSCFSALPGDFLCPIGRQMSLVLRYHKGFFSIVGVASTTKLRLGRPKNMYPFLTDLSSLPYDVQNERRVNPDPKQPEHVQILKHHYNELMKNLLGGAFNYAWIVQTNSNVNDLIKATFACTTNENRLVRKFTEISSQGRSEMQKSQVEGDEDRFISGAETSSSIEIIFDAWDLINLHICLGNCLSQIAITPHLS